MKKLIMLVLPLAALASGCATIVRGTSQNFTVQTDPPGATATLSTGEVCEATPCTFRRSRNEMFTVTVAKDGYLAETHEIRNPWSRRGTTTGIVGNALIGGAIGIGVDAATGANRDLTPNPLSVSLMPAPAPTLAAAPAEATVVPVSDPVVAPAADAPPLAPPPTPAGAPASPG